MARVRSIKPGFFKDPELAELPIEARMFYAGLWCQADRLGRLRDEPKLLKVEIAPWDDIDPEATLARLAQPKKTGKPGFIVRYVADGRNYIWIPQFLEHQRPYAREAESKIPPPPSEVVHKHEPGSAEAALSFVFGLPSSVSTTPLAPREKRGGCFAEPIRLAEKPKEPEPLRAQEPEPPRPLKLRKRRRGITTLAEDKRAELDRIRNDRSKALDAWLVQQRDRIGFGREGPPSRDEQLAWVQTHCHSSPEEASDVVALVEHALAQVQNGAASHARA